MVIHSCKYNIILLNLLIWAIFQENNSDSSSSSPGQQQNGTRKFQELVQVR